MMSDNTREQDDLKYYELVNAANTARLALAGCIDHRVAVDLLDSVLGEIGKEYVAVMETKNEHIHDPCNEMGERKKFEAHYSEVLHPARFSKENGEYIDPITVRMWKAWQARAVIAAEQIERLERENKVLRSQVGILKKHLANFDHFYPDGFQEKE